MLLKWKLNEPCDYISNIINPYTNDGTIETSLSGGLLQKSSVATGCLCHIVLKTENNHVNLKSG